ncbi:MAG: hypothetical protein ACFFEA_10415, partial [Candidatus Thorarchaeota archaeon]
NNLSQVSKGFGISFENTAVRDDRNNAGLPTMPIITNLLSHPLTEDVQDILVPSGCTLNVTNRAIAVASTSDTADPPNKPIIAIAESGKGRVLCIGSYEVFRKGGGMKHLGNQAFAVNAIRWLSGEIRTATPSKVVEEQEKKEEEMQVKVSAKANAEMEKTMRRLVNAVFDLQKDIGKLDKKMVNVEKNIEMLRDQFQDFAEKTQSQLGVMIPARQFLTEEENQAAEIEADVKALEKEVRSVQQLRDHIEERHSSGAMAKDTFTEQSEKLEERLKRLEENLEKKRKELETIID